MVWRRCSLIGVLAIALAGCGGGPEQPVQQGSDQPDSGSQGKPAANSQADPPQTEPAAPAEPEAPPAAKRDLPPPVELTTDDWPQFRGQQRDNKVRSQTKLLRSWPAEGPAVLWETAVGQGYSAPSIVDGKVYLNDYNEETKEWMVRCLTLDAGEELWTYKAKKRIRPNHGITRSAPATDGGFVFSIDPKCELHCLDARDGRLIWKKFLPELYESQIPAWYSGQCPLIEKDRVVVATGGKAVLIALDKATGQPIWETPNEQGFLLSHSSVMPITIDGVRQYVYMTLSSALPNALGGALGVAADSGELLWYFPWKFNTAVAPSALEVDEGQLLLTSGYSAQSVICQVKHEGDSWQAEELVAFPPPTQGWNSEVHTPILHRGHVYGVGKNKRGMWTCLDMQGSEVWTSGKKANFGMGGYVLADGMFFVLAGKTGTLRLVDAEADEYKELAEVKLLSGPDVWAPPVIVKGKLIIRDLGKLICLDVEDKAVQTASAAN